MITEILPLIIAFAAIVVLIAGYVRICIRLRKDGGSLTTIGFGSTYELMTKDRQKASETIVNMNAGIKHEDPHIKELERSASEQTKQKGGN